MPKEFYPTQIVYQEKCLFCPKFRKKTCWCDAFDVPAETVKDCTIWDYPKNIKEIMLKNGSAKVKL